MKSGWKLEINSESDLGCEISVFLILLRGDEGNRLTLPMEAMVCYLSLISLFLFKQRIILKYFSLPHLPLTSPIRKRLQSLVGASGIRSLSILHPALPRDSCFDVHTHSSDSDFVCSSPLLRPRSAFQRQAWRESHGPHCCRGKCFLCMSSFEWVTQSLRIGWCWGHRELGSPYWSWYRFIGKILIFWFLLLYLLFIFLRTWREIHIIHIIYYKNLFFSFNF